MLHPMTEPCAGAMPVTVADRLAGFVVRDAASLRFVAIDRRFGVLDGSRFPRLDAARHAAARIARLVMPEAGGEQGQHAG